MDKELGPFGNGRGDWPFRTDKYTIFAGGQWWNIGYQLLYPEVEKGTCKVLGYWRETLVEFWLEFNPVEQALCVRSIWRNEATGEYYQEWLGHPVL